MQAVEATEPLDIHSARVMILDDEELNVRLLERMLARARYSNIWGLTDPREAFSRFAEIRPDLLLLDLNMPYLDGFCLLERLKESVPGPLPPILVLTVDATRESKLRALAAGARDFLTKPFDQAEALLRVGNLLESRLLHRWLQECNAALAERVTARTHELEEAHIEILRRLARACEYRDDATGRHAERVGQMAYRLALALGVSQVEAERIRLAAPLHDVGKVGIPDSILSKAGPLTAEEMAIMRGHCTIGAQILSGSRFPLLQMAEEIAATHHERWDGSGYPLGLSGNQIPLTGRIVAVVDAYDALVQPRPYKAALSQADAVAELRRGAGSHFDPVVVEKFLELLHA